MYGPGLLLRRTLQRAGVQVQQRPRPAKHACAEHAHGHVEGAAPRRAPPEQRPDALHRAARLRLPARLPQHHLQQLGQAVHPCGRQPHRKQVEGELVLVLNLDAVLNDDRDASPCDRRLPAAQGVCVRIECKFFETGRLTFSSFCPLWISIHIAENCRIAGFPQSPHGFQEP